MENIISTTDSSEATANVSDFKALISDPELLNALDRMNLKIPTPVQLATLPAALTGKDLIVQAKTGSGKTLAYVLPIIQRIKQSKDRHTQAIIVAPTRELAVQICEVIHSLDQGVRSACLIGGMSMRDQVRDLDQDHRVVVGTPGRLNDLIRERILILRKTSQFVLDEADEMLSMGFLEDVRAILSRLPSERQGLFISATITPRVEQLASMFLREPERITISSPGEEYAPIDHLCFELSGELTAKATALCDILETYKPNSAIIFCNTKSDTELVEVYLRRRGFDARRINSDLNQKQRNAIMGRIRSGDLRFLVATDIAARGLDIESIDLVVNYAIPEEPESYIHRTGRTGRAGRSGKAISLVGPQDFRGYHALKKAVTFELKQMALPTETEVIAARREHFLALMKEARITVSDRDSVLVTEILRQDCGQPAPSQAEVEFLAKLCRFTSEHFLAQNTRALEEEVAAEPGDGQRGGGANEGSDYGSGSGRQSESRNSGDYNSGGRSQGRNSGGSRDRGRGSSHRGSSGGRGRSGRH